MPALAVTIKAMIFSVDHILQAGGILAVALIIFAECGLLVGFFLPGDTLLIAAGIFASQHKLNIYVLLPVVSVAAIIGYQVGYQIGLKGGPRVFKRKDGLLFRKRLHPPYRKIHRAPRWQNNDTGTLYRCGTHAGAADCRHRQNA